MGTSEAIEKCYVCCCCGIIHCMCDEESNCNTCLATTCGRCEHVCCNGQIADLENPRHFVTGNLSKAAPKAPERKALEPIKPRKKVGNTKPTTNPETLPEESVSDASSTSSRLEREERQAAKPVE